MSDANPPHTREDVSGLLEKTPIHVHAWYDVVDDTIGATLVQGGGSKDADSAIDMILINIILRCPRKRPQIIYVVNDCGSLQHNQHMVHMSQWLVDHGFCLFCIIGYHQQLHGKWKADFKFGHWAIAWGNAAVFTAHCLARVIETLPRRSKTGRRVQQKYRDRAVLVNSNTGSVHRHHGQARYVTIGGLGGEYDNVHVVVAGHDLAALSNAELRTQRMSKRSGLRVHTTSLRAEMAVLASGTRGVVRLWSYPPEPHGERAAQEAELDGSWAAEEAEAWAPPL
jgi:hypothetical protein